MVVGSALFHFVNGCPAMVQSPTRWNQFVARTLGGPGHSLRGRFSCAVGLSEDRRLSYFFLSGSLVAPDERGLVLSTLWSAGCRARCPCAQGAALGNEPLLQRPLAARFPNRLVLLR